jgi:opacity protein-like surface antigen
MNRKLPILVLSFALAAVLATVLSTAASAQEAVESVGTIGSGELRRASEVMIRPKAGNISARIPGVISKGEVIQIQYEDSGSVADSFMVTGISIQGDRCAIESRRTMPNGPEIRDMIYASPCKKLR